jgi:hypothetical protein
MNEPAEEVQEEEIKKEETPAPTEKTEKTVKKKSDLPIGLSGAMAMGQMSAK